MQMLNKYKTLSQSPIIPFANNVTLLCELVIKGLLNSKCDGGLMAMAFTDWVDYNDFIVNLCGVKDGISVYIHNNVPL